MTDYEKLKELLDNTFAEQYEKRGLLTAHHTAKDLLANGVIVPPCKVGQTVWFPSKYYDRPLHITITHLEIYEEETVIYSEGGTEWKPEDLGKTIFLTKEEAEKALKERSEGK